MREYHDYVEDLRPTHPDLAETFAPYHGLESVLQWMKGLDLPTGAIDLIAQDEFEYDFLVPLPPDGAWVVFGVT